MLRTIALPITTAIMLMPLSAGAVMLDNPENATASLAIAGRHVLTVAPVGHFGARERILEIERRLARVLRVEKPTALSAQPTGIEPYRVLTDVKTATINGLPTVCFKGIPMASVTTDDAKQYGRPAMDVAQMWAHDLRMGLLELKDSGVKRLDQALRRVDIAYAGEPLQGPERVAYRLAHREVQLDEF